MDLVVVFLKDVKEHKIVPESYVHDLCVSALKNRGNNACQNRLIFWSGECIEGLRYPNPNKNAKKSDTFPTGVGGAWYLGRTLFFTGNYKLFLNKREYILLKQYCIYCRRF